MTESSDSNNSIVENGPAELSFRNRIFGTIGSILLAFSPFKEGSTALELPDPPPNTSRSSDTQKNKKRSSKKKSKIKSKRKKYYERPQWLQINTQESFEKILAPEESSLEAVSNTDAVHENPLENGTVGDDREIGSGGGLASLSSLSSLIPIVTDVSRSPLSLPYEARHIPLLRGFMRYMFLGVYREATPSNDVYLSGVSSHEGQNDDVQCGFESDLGNYEEELQRFSFSTFVKRPARALARGFNKILSLTNGSVRQDTNSLHSAASQEYETVGSGSDSSVSGEAFYERVAERKSPRPSRSLNISLSSSDLPDAKEQGSSVSLGAACGGKSSPEKSQNGPKDQRDGLTQYVQGSLPIDTSFSGSFESLPGSDSDKYRFNLFMHILVHGSGLLSDHEEGAGERNVDSEESWTKTYDVLTKVEVPHTRENHFNSSPLSVGGTVSISESSAAGIAISGRTEFKEYAQYAQYAEYTGKEECDNFENAIFEDASETFATLGPPLQYVAPISAYSEFEAANDEPEGVDSEYTRELRSPSSSERMDLFSEFVQAPNFGLFRDSNPGSLESMLASELSYPLNFGADDVAKFAAIDSEPFPSEEPPSWYPRPSDYFPHDTEPRTFRNFSGSVEELSVIAEELEEHDDIGSGDQETDAENAILLSQDSNIEYYQPPATNSNASTCLSSRSLQLVFLVAQPESLDLAVSLRLSVDIESEIVGLEPEQEPQPEFEPELVIEPEHELVLEPESPLSAPAIAIPTESAELPSTQTDSTTPSTESNDMNKNDLEHEVEHTSHENDLKRSLERDLEHTLGRDPHENDSCGNDLHEIDSCENDLCGQSFHENDPHGKDSHENGSHENYSFENDSHESNQKHNLKLTSASQALVRYGPHQTRTEACTRTKRSWYDYSVDTDTDPDAEGSIFEAFFASHGISCPPYNSLYRELRDACMPFQCEESAFLAIGPVVDSAPAHNDIESAEEDDTIQGTNGAQLDPNSVFLPSVDFPQAHEYTTVVFGNDASFMSTEDTSQNQYPEVASDHEGDTESSQANTITLDFAAEGAIESISPRNLEDTLAAIMSTIDCEGASPVHSEGQSVIVDLHQTLSRTKELVGVCQQELCKMLLSWARVEQLLLQATKKRFSSSQVTSVLDAATSASSPKAKVKKSVRFVLDPGQDITDSNLSEADVQDSAQFFNDLNSEVVTGSANLQEATVDSKRHTCPQLINTFLSPGAEKISRLALKILSINEAQTSLVSSGRQATDDISDALQVMDTVESKCWHEILEKNDNAIRDMEFRFEHARRELSVVQRDFSSSTTDIMDTMMHISMTRDRASNNFLNETNEAKAQETNGSGADFGNPSCVNNSHSFTKWIYDLEMEEFKDLLYARIKSLATLMELIETMIQQVRRTLEGMKDDTGLGYGQTEHDSQNSQNHYLGEKLSQDPDKEEGSDLAHGEWSGTEPEEKESLGKKSKRKNKRNKPKKSRRFKPHK